jgi:peptide chain release factor
VTVRLQLSAGRGPVECAWAVAELLRRMASDADGQGAGTRTVETVAGERPGTYRSALVELTGPGAAAFAVSWTGTVCWQAPSPWRTGASRKNWYVTVQPYQSDPAYATFDERDVEVVACRTGGPGGQHRNKASTAVRATHRPSGTVVVVDTERQFGLNRRLAMDLLRQRLEDGNAAADRAVELGRWRVHDALVRGNPTRTERPHSPTADAPAVARRPRAGQNQRGA